MPIPLRDVCLLSSCVLLPLLPAQEGDAVPTEYVLQVPPGGWIDLDTGLLLPQPRFRTFQADLCFGRDGGGFYLEPLHGGARAAGRVLSPPDELAKDRVRIERHATSALAMFVRTDRGFARVELMVADPYSTASASLRWVVVPPKNPVFLNAPTDVTAAWQGAKLHVQWSGEQPRWLVEVQTGDRVRKLSCGEPRLLIDELEPKTRHVVRVRGMTEGGDVSMPADVVQWGPRQVPVAGVVSYADRWYDRAGGLRLSTGEAAVEDAEVVLYLYGVFVPGGGVAKVGRGEGDFGAMHDLPAGPFPPVYDRLDDDDVLVVRLADGRYGKLWLRPQKDDDLRSGMDVHFVFLPDGRRMLLAPPAEITSERVAAGYRLAWAQVAGAERYEVTVPGRAQPLACAEPSIVLAALAPERTHEVQVVAIAADGERSSAARAVVVTYAGEFRHERAVVTAQQGGFDFARGAGVAAGQPCDLALVGGAGGASVLHFRGTAIAPGGAFAFGEFPSLDRLQFATEWSSDERNEGSERCYVRTADGGIASVRIVEREWPSPVLEYVWLAKR